ncbi:unnamed protein product [Cyprideis torosa]|uniref:Uncharacterized protein n=1 Tax=Cyprideis torosa TaxID=163714 RepID=A0A7R8ZRZ8_9CRUS|nr:unnamed protein product [Cyprideis torosa]CAG0900341.1 unnamed protein product [Cyprideis torosa]
MSDMAVANGDLRYIADHEQTMRDQAKKMNVQSLRSNEEKKASRPTTTHHPDRRPLIRVKMSQDMGFHGPSFAAYQAPWQNQVPAMAGNPYGQMAGPGVSQAGLYGNVSIVDKVPPEILHLIDAHWYQFPPINPLMSSLLGFFLFIMGLVSVSGNLTVIYIFMSTRSLKTPSNLLIVSLAFSDLIMMVTMVPPFVINCYYETWVFGETVCSIYGMFGSLSGCASIWALAMIALDRYNVIVKGLAAKPMTYKGALGKILFVWAFSLIWTIAPLLGWNRYVPEGNMAVCGTDSVSQDWMTKSYLIVYSTWVYFIPLAIILFSYFYIVQAVADHEQTMRDQAKKMNVQSLRSNEEKKASAEVRLAKIAIITCTLWFIAWTPYLIINWNGMFNRDAVTPLFTVWGSVFAKLAACYNPIVYGISHPKYRAALLKKMPCLDCARDSGEDDDSKSVGTVATAAPADMQMDEKPTA